MFDDTTIWIALASLGTVLGVLLTAFLAVVAGQAWSWWTTDSGDAGDALEPDFALLQRIQQHHTGMANDAFATMVVPGWQEHMAGA